MSRYTPFIKKFNRQTQGQRFYARYPRIARYNMRYARIKKAFSWKGSNRLLHRSYFRNKMGY